ncbi:TIGR03620 family F420-dependent LLM class oxidoreductase [Herbiconiux daphne]|uniref:TIGR03620 family F420-dependent LLM class oxidoreductase n=1 Tax=Herbiconiux daphne TaxID=2970914 RepID=A0ABT2H5A5_9MICO|nr:TIGR03620 family F420-dependent LLM class oxidoreductase [Herbiconiux daphne]MCS5735078.1 TIGR03620 family F420-dependent LLM class oxidoreductase [Herbiconiux daphne]
MNRPNTASLRAQLGPVGVWSNRIGETSASTERTAAKTIESLGYGALWFGETPHSKEALVHASILLQATSAMTIATGIANVYGRDPLAAESAANALADAFDNRFILGLGASHAPLVKARGHSYTGPLTAVRDYLNAMDTVSYAPPKPAAVPRVLGALRPRMLELARDRTAGAHPYFVPVAHTKLAREVLGPDRILAPELMVILESDPTAARALARGTTAGFLALPNYANNLRELGYSDDDLAGGGSDRLVDDIVAWGTLDEIQNRVEAHLDAGADHVAIQPLAADLGFQLQQLRILAHVLLDR